jgi:hypothetical protein
MAITSKYIFAASMDVASDKEALFNEVYDIEHVPNLLSVPGVRAAARFRGEAFALSIGGEQKWIAHENPHYTAIYEIDDPQVLISRAWAVAGEAGRWPGQVRPHTRNRRLALYKVLSASSTKR